MAYRFGNGRSHADRCKIHDDLREFEHYLGQQLHAMHELLFLRRRQQCETNAEKHAENHYLQHLAMVNGFRHVFGK